MSSVVSTVYRFVVDDVLKNVKSEFLSEGVDESVLHELQQLWESNLIKSGAFSGGAFPDHHDHSHSHSHSHHHVTYERPQTYAPETLLHNAYPYFDPTLSYALAGAVPNELLMQKAPMLFPGQVPPVGAFTTTTTSTAGLSEGTLPSFAALSADVQLGRPTPYMMPTWAGATPNLNLLGAGRTSEKSQDPKRNKGNIPQHDGTNDEPEETDSTQENEKEKEKWLAAQKADAELEKELNSQPLVIDLIQVDGGGDEEKKKRSRKQKKKEVLEDEDELPAEEAEDENDEPLGSDLDDEDQKQDEPVTDHLVVCLYEKVTRIKNKRKCNLRDGVMHLNGRDYLFHRATGEFDW